MNRVLIAMGLAMTITSSAMVGAEGNAVDVTDMKALGVAVKTDRRALVATTLQLTESEAKKFWPAYDAYQRSCDISGRQRNLGLESLVGSSKPISDLYAKKLASELVAADDAEIKARRTLYKQVMKALPATKAARYLQLESKIRALQAYDIAVAFPLIK